ncbi:MAG: hypothetical protein AAGH82_11090, partial [Pseudomonadota bacterium]
GGESGLKFTREESGEQSDEGLKFQRQDGAGGNEGLKFTRENTNGDDGEAPGSVTPMPNSADSPDGAEGGEPSAPAADEGRPRPRRAFAPISK